MSVSGLLSRLRSLQVEVWTEAGKLRYSAPAGVMTAGLRAELAQSKDELLAALADRGGAGRQPVLGAIPRPAGVPLSPAQLRLWFVHQLAPESALYNSVQAFLLRGPLSPPVLAAALGELVRRHEALRTTFAMRDGGPVQEVAAELPLPLPLIDLRAVPLAAADPARLAVDLARQRVPVLDLERGPLVSALLLRLAGGEHALVFLVPHLVSDGWSTGVAMAEVARLYAAFLEGRPSPLPELPVQYADFVLWQRALHQGEGFERRLAHWRERLAGAPEVLDLPTDRPRPAAQTYAGGRHPFAIPADTSLAFKALARREGVTLFMAALAVFDLLLAACSGQDDVVVGTPLTGRTHRDLEGLVGCFMDTLVLRSSVRREMSVRELLAHVRDVAAAAYEHQDVPFATLVTELRPERNPAVPALVQAMFALRVPQPRVALPGLELEALETDSGIALLDLLFELADGPGGLSGFLEINTDLFDRATALRFTERYARLLAGAAAHPDRAVGDLDLLGEAERHQLLAIWNDTRPSSALPTVHALVAAQAARTPRAAAVEQDGEVLVYAELDARANRLARHLRRLGAGPEVRVAVCAERSPALIVALLGILKAGAAYVPIDPAYPRERLALMLEDAGVALAVAQRRTAPALLDLLGPAARAVLLDEGEPWWEESAAEVDELAAPGNAAYVIYTSGSTGRPKGVLVPHGGLASFALTAAAGYGFAPGERVLQFASINFDTSVEEIFPSLAGGATLVLRTEEMLGSVARFLEHCAAWRISVLDLPTAWWHEMVVAMTSGGLDLPAAVRLVIVGGEHVLAARWAEWHAHTGACVRLVNGYGPTEATVVATWTELGRPVRAGRGWREAAIGRPIGGARAYVLDPRHRLQPVGIAGELCVGGAGVVRGYLGDPAATAARFIPDPFGAGPGARLYRTGDLARFRPDGDIEFLGRVDSQVKIRGFRVEPGEVEALLAGHPAIAEAAVVAREEAPGARRLAAYAVPAAGAAGAEVTAAGLRSWLAGRLPEHMVPSAVVLLDLLPRTPAGKIDRRALPAPEARAGLEEGYVPPRGPAEEMVASIWADVLGVERVGAGDNFFALGGHSLLAAQIVARLQEVFHVDLPLRAFFEAPTLAELTASLEAAGAAGASSSLPPLVPVPRAGDLPLSPAQERIFFLARLDPESVSYHVPRAYWIGGRLEIPALARAYRGLLARHEILRTTFVEAGGGPVQRIHPAVAPEDFVLPVIDLRDVPQPWRGRELDRLILEDSRRPFDLARGPLLRASLARTADDEQVAIQCEHHLVHDGWAEAVLLRDLLELYRAAAERRAPGLPELPVQYADFAVWQRQWLSGGVLEEQLAYWRGRLAGAPPLLALPADRPRPAVLSSRGGGLDLTFPAAAVRGLRAVGRQEGATLFMASFAVFAALLLRLSGQEDLVVGSGVANRRRRETEGMLGMVINTLALRTDLSGDPSLREVLRRVRETCLGAYAHQDVPFDRVVEALRPERSLSHSPVFQVAFAFHDAELPEADLPGLRVRQLESHNRSSKFDLLLIAIPQRGSGGDAGEPGEDGDLFVHAEHSADLFDGATVRRWMGSLGTLLAAAVADADAPLCELPLLSAAGRHQVIGEWSGGGAVEAREALPAHESFRAWSSQEPGAVALAAGAESWTYGELDRWSGRLARHLRALGVGPETVVALLLDRSPEAVASILAVMRAGGAWMPLDPAYPRERTAWLLADSGAPLVLTRRELAGQVELPDGPRVVLLEDLATDRPDPEGTWGGPDSLAYVIYTSGSTGRPKGVGVPHRGLSELVKTQAEAFEVRPGSRVLQFAALTFDASVSEILVTLANGAALVLAPREEMMPGPAFARLLREQQVEIVTLPPSVLAAMPDEPLSGLRTLVVAGEACPPELPARWAAGRRFVNAYGPTEATVCVTTAVLGAGDRTVPIGRPLPGVRACVLDRAGRPAPAGVPGELCAGGPGVARGYLGRPGLTAERFVPDPFGRPGDRLYRTGDLARWRPGGHLELLGRIDRQIKLRGFRIEPGEVEAVLLEQPGVAGAAVAALPDAAGDLRLVAYLASPEGAPDEAQLRTALARRLPAPLIPSLFVTLPALPLTASGKVDRSALPSPDGRRAPAPCSMPPSTPVQQQIAGLWRDLLGSAEIGVHDPFFALGGHSLQAMRMLARLRQDLGVEVPVRAFFERPTIAGLEAAVAAARVEPAGRGEGIGRRPAGEDPLSFAQQRLWILDRIEPGSATYNVPFALRLGGALHRGALERALSEVLARHEGLRAGFVARNGRPAQVFAPPGPCALPAVDLSGLPAFRREPEARSRASELAARPFDLASPPLLRACLLELGGGERVLLAVFHHAVFDGWSAGVFVRELAELYAARGSGRPSPLPPLPIQYADFAWWQRERLQGGTLDRLLAAWRERLAGMPGALDLPTDRPRPAVQTFRGARAPWRLARGPEAALRALCERSGATLFMALLAAFEDLLRRWSGQDDFGVATFAAGRPHPDTEGLIGFFVNTLVLRAHTGGDPSFAELLGRVREVTAEAYEHAELPFERLVEELRVERDPARPPLAQVAVVLQNAPMPALDLGELGIRPFDLDLRTARMELVLYLWETEDGLAGSLEHNTDLFDPTTVRRLLGQYGALLEAAGREPGRRLSELALLCAAERHQLLAEWNDTAAGREEATLHGLFAAQVERTPDAVALIAGRERLVYAELLARAGRIAAALRARGVGPETRVAVCLPRTPDLVATLLGVLAAGGAYVPIDPAYPPERVAFLLEDSGASMLLDGTEALSGAGPLSPSRAAGPGDLAYLIYTSGSTGRPKGVAIEHRSAAALVRWAAGAFAPGELAGVLAATSACFDLSVFEIFVPLSRGGAVVLAENALELPDLPARAEVTLVNTVPSVLAALLRSGGLPAGVRTVNLAGEPLRRDLAERIHALPGVERLLNLYGPSEDTTYSTWEAVAPGRSGEPAIGRPVAGTRAYLLDSTLQPLPPGARGLLWLAGEGLARGYHGRPGLTAERFRPDPFSGVAGGRMYGTGDLARLRPDGRLDFLGRADQQVKIRGFRIEPGEIEAALAGHPGVREAAVLVRRDGGDPQLAAFVVPNGSPVPADELRRHLRQSLPEFMIPALFAALPELPRTAGGKVDRPALAARRPEPGAAAEAAAEAAPPRTALERRIAEIWRGVLGRAEVGVHDSFFDLGGHSLLLVEVHERLRREIAPDLPVLDLFRYPTVASLAARLAPEPAPAAAPRARSRRAGAGGPWDVAVVGLAVRFPDAPDAAAFWRNLRAGFDSSRELSAADLLAAGVPAATLRDPAYVRRRPVLDGVELFDPFFFGLNPLEAALMDPQHRLFLEIAWEALEDAGCDPARPPGRIGVFAGAGMNTYLWSNLASNPELLDAVGGFQAMLGNDKDYVATRVSYKLDLKGPSVLVQSACSTSLVAIYLACRGLLDGDCDAALAGGVTVRVPQLGYRFEEGGIHSPDGRCRAFDAGALGTTSGSGAGAVVLKRLEDALADGDAIRAVIKGAAVNNDGALKVGYTAPGVEGQAAVIAEALARAGVAPASVSYVETHGTGTPLGDPIEAAALGEALGPGRPRPCSIGSVKTNIGHLDAAAGAAGFVKTVLALQHGEIPPSLHFSRPNPKIDFAAAGLRVADRLTAWERWDGGPRRAGVSSFGVGGTNVHVVLEEAPEPEPPLPARPGALLLLSARTPAALEARSQALASHLEGLSGPGLCDVADVAHTLQVGRRHFEHRRYAVCPDADPAAAAAALAGLDPGRVGTGAAGTSERPVIFLFPGQGTGYVGMGAGLYEAEPVFRDALDRCAGLAGPLLAAEGSPDLRRLLYPSGSEAAAAARALDRIALGQPALFAVEYAMARLWMEWGVRPRAMAGHSVGEFTAACLAGVFPLEEALRLVVERSRLMQELPPGAMLSVPLPEEETAPLLARFAGRLSLAAVNAPSECLVAGPAPEVEALEADLRSRGIDVRRLHVAVAGHSWMNEPLVEPFAAAVARAAPRPPQIPYVTNLTGTWVTDGQATDPLHWGRHLARTVRFAAGLAELCRDPDAVLLEVGPGRSLANLARQTPAASGRPILPSLRHATDARPDRPFLLHTLGRLWLAGVAVDWERFAAPERRRRVPLPAYPFERQRCWIEPRPAARAGAPSLARRCDPADWFHAVSWQRTAPTPPRSGDGASPWLVFTPPGSGLGRRILERLRESGRPAIAVEPCESSEPNTSFERTGELEYRLAPGDGAGYGRLLEDLVRRGLAPAAVLHLWSLDVAGGSFSEAQELGFHSLLHLARALARHAPGEVRVGAVGSGLQEVTGGEPLRPECATLLGPCLVVPQEHPALRFAALDVPPPGGGDTEEDRLAAALIAEVDAGADAPLVALRGGHRWVRELTPLPAGETPEGSLALREGGTHLITGGLGRIGLVIAEVLARRGARGLVLCGRSGAPPRETWERRAGDPEDPESGLLRRLLALESLGAEVLAVAADVADAGAVARLRDRARERFGHIDGVFHAAGVVGAQALRSVEASAPAECEPQFRAKVLGLLEVERALADDPPDFYVLCSSLSAFLGGLGYAAYAGANCALDAFAQLRARGAGPRWMSVDWEAWRFAVEPEAPSGPGALLSELALAPGEGAAVLERLFTSVPALAQVVISTADPAARTARWLPPAAPAGAAPAAQANLASRPHLPAVYVPPRDEDEERVAAVWRDLLGIEEIGIHDGFFELGGHSVLATRLVARLRENLRTELPLETFFADPTVAGVAASVRSSGAAGRARRLEEILQEIEGMSEGMTEEMTEETTA